MQQALLLDVDESVSGKGYYLFPSKEFVQKLTVSKRLRTSFTEGVPVVCQPNFVNQVEQALVDCLLDCMVAVRASGAGYYFSDTLVWSESGVVKIVMDSISRSNGGLQPLDSTFPDLSSRRLAYAIPFTDDGYVKLAKLLQQLDLPYHISILPPPPHEVLQQLLPHLGPHAGTSENLTKIETRDAAHSPEFMITVDERSTAKLLGIYMKLSCYLSSNNAADDSDGRS